LLSKEIENKLRKLNMNKIGVILINLGTPDHCNHLSVYRYLKEFLSDPRVIDLAALPRWILTNLIIVPFRYKKTTQAYQAIWQKTGSPLLINSQKLQTALSKELGDSYQIEIAMRYGKPSISRALNNLSHCNQLVVIPLFPQYSSAATGSAIAQVFSLLEKKWNIPSIKLIKDFYNHPGYINAYADIIKKTIVHTPPEYILFSYHGLPERHIVKSGCQARCDRFNTCPSVTEDNFYCYRAQCYTASYLLANALNLSHEQYKVVFQSRLGRTAWIKPYTDLVLSQLRQKNIKNIAVVCPSFVADCLETLEEINIRLRKQWLLLGGQTLTFIPCLNDHPRWVKAIAEMIDSTQLTP
jgi:ferrochelatase